VEPNLRRAVELFSQGIKQGSLFTKSGNPQNFSGSRRPFISTDPVPVNQGRTPIPPSFRPNPVSPGQLGLFDIRATPSSFNPSLERTGPPRIPFSPNPPSSFNPSLERIGPPGPLRSFGALERIGPPGPLRSLTESAALTGEVRSVGPFDVRSNPPSSFNPSLERIGPPGPLRSLTGSEALTTGKGPQSPMKRGGIIEAIMLAAEAERSTPLPNYKNLGYASEADMKGRIGAQELLQSGRYVPGSQQQTMPDLYSVQELLQSGRYVPGSQQQSIPNQTPLPRNNPPASNVPNQAPLPQGNPPGNTMTPAAAFTRFFVDDANRLSPTAMELATATGGVQTRDLGSLTSGLKAADLESVLNSVASAQAMSDSPSFMAGNPLMGTPKLMLSGARDQAVNEQKQQYAKQGAPKGITNEQRDYVLTMQAQQAAGKVLLPEILKNLGYSPQDPATRDLAVWAESNPGLALAVYNKQLEQNLNNRSDFPSPRELSSSDPVNQQSASNVEGTMVNSPMGANLARNAVANSHFKADAYVSGSQLSNELADATQPLVQPTLQTAEQFIDQAPERAEATAQISDEMLKRAMELKLGKMSMDPSLLGN